MLIVYLLIPLSIILLAFAVWAFFWAVNNGQFDDLDTPAERILHDDDETVPRKLHETNRSHDKPVSR